MPAEAFLGDELGRARGALGAWRTAWSELLGIGKGDRVRPHIPALAESKLKALHDVSGVAASLAGHAARRADGEARMKAAAGSQ